MQIIYAYGRGEVVIDGVTSAICEGGAGNLRGQYVTQMHVGGWPAVKAAIDSGGTFPPIDPVKAKAYYAQCRDGDVLLSNFFENRFDAYHAKQVVAALKPAQPRLQVYHYAFPSFDPMGEVGDAFWRRLKPCVDGLAPGYYAHDQDDPDNWLHRDYCRMAFQVSESIRYIGDSDKELCFVISPQTHQGKDIKPAKLLAQVNFLESLGVKKLFLWSKYGPTPANLAAVKTATTRVAVQPLIDS